MGNLSVKKVVLFLSIAFLLYSIYVLFSGFGLNPTNHHWDFSVSGAFGDSFGPLNAFLALVAAISATAAFLDQRAELRRVKEDVAKEQSLTTKRDFEQTFFNLLEIFKDTLQQISYQYIGLPGKSFSGRRAIRGILGSDIGLPSGALDTDRKHYVDAYRQNRDGLAHYFRLFYHILKYLDNSSVDDKNFYSRLLRATLSEPEIIIIALNCMHGGGRRKLKPLVEKYSMLHNISSTAAVQWQMTVSFDHEAFGDRTVSSWTSDRDRMQEDELDGD